MTATDDTITPNSELGPRAAREDLHPRPVMRSVGLKA
jgi:hypothetical protein